MAQRFLQLGGAFGAEQALREMVANRIAAEMEQRKRAVENYELAQADRGMDIDESRVTEGGRQFDLGHALNTRKVDEDVRQFDAQAPHREAQAGYLRTQSKHLEGADARAATERQHDIDMANLQGRIRTGHINLEGLNRRSPEEDLNLFEAKEKIKAQYGGSKPSLGAERNALAFFNRAKQASEDIGNMEEGMAKQGLMGQMQQQYAHNMLQTTEQQQYRQAQRAFTEARLRKESGAAIPQGEYENDARTYFAQPGDSPDVIAQKRRARQTVLEGLKFSSGKAYDEFYGQQEQPPAPAGPKPGGVSIKSIRQVR